MIRNGTIKRQFVPRLLLLTAIVVCKQRAFELDPRGRDVVGAHLGFSKQQKQYEPIFLRFFVA